MTKKLTLENFIEKCNNIHNNYYNYDKVIYKNARTKVIVTCPKHGNFLITPSSHLDKRGCNMCGNNILTTSEFIDKAKKIHNNFYSYEDSVYYNNRIKIIITCPIHGNFLQSSNKHLIGRGCPKCVGKSKTSDDIIKEFINVHGERYDYSLVNYKGCAHKVKIICKTHGVFEQQVAVHLAKNGCTKCGNNTSFSGNEFIKSFNNENIKPENTIKIGKKRFKVDGFDLTTNTIYEYFGSFWHGHPDRKDLIGIHPILNIPYSELYQKTLDKIEYFKENGYKVIYKWGR